jgi:nitrate/nitrite-specific signal transduction histidine kinase
MRERAEDNGAQIDIDSEPGVGTRITVQWQELEQHDSDHDLLVGNGS